MAKGVRLVFLCLLLLAASHPAQAVEETPPVEDPWLGQAMQNVRPGIQYDPARQTWDFYGIVDQMVRFRYPPAMIDLARVRYRLEKEGEIRAVWVALGVEFPYGQERGYLTRGPWISAANARRWVDIHTLVRVSVSANGVYESPAVSENGVDWSACSQEVSCIYAAQFDAMHMDLSNTFIATGSAPGWYPWGFLFWHVEPLENPFMEQITGQPMEILPPVQEQYLLPDTLIDGDSLQVKIR